MSDVMEDGSHFLRDLGSAANRNPLSAALIGMGVVWLFAGRNGARRARSIVGWASDMTGQAVNSARSATGAGASAAGRAMNASVEASERRWTDIWDDAAHFGREQNEMRSGYSRSIPEKGAGQLQEVGNGLADLFRQQPLALGAIGVAIGAGIAAALPLTEIERTQLGEASAAVKERSGEFVAEQSTRAKDMAGRALDAASDEARRQGLTPEGIKSSADEMTAKVGRVIDAANEGISERAKEQTAPQQ